MNQFLSHIKKIIPRRLFLFLQPAYHFGLAFLAALLYRFPSRKLTVIGVTGTKGKTTTVELIRAALEGTGRGVASASSLQFFVRGKAVHNECGMTMPGRFFMQKFLRGAVRQKCAYAILEVTSQGIEQYRHRFIHFDGAVVTGIAPEHIEAHGSFEAYLRAKLDLFWRLPAESIAVINRDDAYADRFIAACRAYKTFFGKEKITTPKHTFPLKPPAVSAHGIEFHINGTQIISPLRGEFNYYNILAAVSVGLSLRLTPAQIAAGIAKISEVPGRMQIVQQDPFLVVVDYAHTPDSLRAVYSSLQKTCRMPARPYPPVGGEGGSHVACRLICVLGAAGGGRDAWKRPEFGKIAGEYCSQIILTNEDPFDEDPKQILRDIEAGVPAHARHIVRNILDRREAIHTALRLARSGDAVAITGKGSETYIRVAHGERIPWSDTRVAEEELAALQK